MPKNDNFPIDIEFKQPEVAYHLLVNHDKNNEQFILPLVLWDIILDYLDVLTAAYISFMPHGEGILRHYLADNIDLSTIRSAITLEPELAYQIRRNLDDGICDRAYQRCYSQPSDVLTGFFKLASSFSISGLVTWGAAKLISASLDKLHLQSKQKSLWNSLKALCPFSLTYYSFDNREDDGVNDLIVNYPGESKYDRCYQSNMLGCNYEYEYSCESFTTYLNQCNETVWVNYNSVCRSINNAIDGIPAGLIVGGVFVLGAAVAISCFGFICMNCGADKYQEEMLNATFNISLLSRQDKLTQYLFAEGPLKEFKQKSNRDVQEELYRLMRLENKTQEIEINTGNITDKDCLFFKKSAKKIVEEQSSLQRKYNRN